MGPVKFPMVGVQPPLFSTCGPPKTGPHAPAKVDNNVYNTSIKVGAQDGPHGLWLDGKINNIVALRGFSMVGINGHCFLRCGPLEVCIYLIMLAHGPKII